MYGSKLFTVNAWTLSSVQVLTNGATRRLHNPTADATPYGSPFALSKSKLLIRKLTMGAFLKHTANIFKGLSNRSYQGWIGIY